MLATNVSLNEYMVENFHSLILEKAVDEYLQAENEVIVEGETFCDRMCDDYIEGLTQDEIDDFVNGDMEFFDSDITPEDLYNNEIDDEVIEMMNNIAIQPEVEELD